MNIRVIHGNQVQIGLAEPLTITDGPDHFRMSGIGLGVYRNKRSGEIVIGGFDFSECWMNSMEYELLAPLTEKQNHI